MRFSQVRFLAARSTLLSAFLLSALLLIVSLPGAEANAQTTITIDPTGGMLRGARIMRITSLDDSGPGTLREALDAAGPRVVVFEIAGYIPLQRPLDINTGDISILGQTAPTPGVILRGSGLKIRASNVVVEHLTITPGAADPAVAENQDGITIYGSVSHRRHVTDVLLRNLSVGWGVDENVALQGLVDNVRIEHSLIFQGLRYGGHPEGSHSMNLLVGTGVRRVSMYANVFASSDQRSARLTRGNEVAFYYNLVYGPGRRALHIDFSALPGTAPAIDLVGNFFAPNPDTNCGAPAISVAPAFFAPPPEARFYFSRNSIVRFAGAACPDWPLTSIIPPGALARRPNFRLAGADRPLTTLEILNNVGARPRERGPIETAVLRSIERGVLRIPDRDADVVGWPPLPQSGVETRLPVHDLSNARRIAALKRWICERTGEVTLEVVERRCEDGTPDGDTPHL